MKKLTVLMLVTSHDQLGNTGKPTGIWGEELSTPYYELIDAGIDVVIASPKGGRPPFATGSVKEPIEANEGSMKRFLTDPVAMKKFNESVQATQVQSGDYDGIFLPGGHGTMWDTATDQATARLVGEIFSAGKPTAAVCHGPAGLVKAKRSDGQSILLGKKVNGFTNEEETAAGLMDVVPFHLETVMRQLGGQFENGPMWGPYAVRDGNLITGQNPASSALVARHMVDALLGK
jgi:putative intracellular protease/amidase